MRNPSLRIAAVAVVTAVSALAGCGMMNRGDPMASSSMPASTTSMSSPLTASQEVPPTSSNGSGTVSTRYDRSTRMLSYTVTYSGLSGPLTAAHFHGPAASGVNAGVVLPITTGPSPISGSATLTEAQAGDLMAGKWYVNLHTAANPNGEIRAQVMPRM